MSHSVLYRSLLAASLSATLVACIEPGSGEHSGESVHALATGNAYAESVYRNYQEAAGARISFELSVLESGRMDEIAAISANDLLGVPATWVRMSARGTEIIEITREPREPATDEWQQEVDLRQLAHLGRSLATGSYRVLQVTATQGGAQVASHKALELCWAEDAYCLVMDPVMLQADAYLHERQRLLAEGWEPQVSARAADPAQRQMSASGVCALNSDSSKTSISYTYPSYQIAHKNIFGMTVVRKEMGEQTAGLSCYINGAGACVSGGFGYSQASSCKASFGYSCDCDNTGNLIGVSADGAAGRAWSETRCTHRALLSARVSFAVQGTGADFGVQWDTAGSVDASGGQLYDSCALYAPAGD